MASLLAGSESGPAEEASHHQGDGGERSNGKDGGKTKNGQN